MKPIYIDGAARVGATFQVSTTGASPEFEDPDYTTYLPKRKLRRLNNVSRYALHSAYAALEAADNPPVSGIVLGVGQTISNTVDGMLRKLISHQEEQTNPTFFMNSLLSTAAGQMALQLACDGYSNTHTQRGFSVEAALLDASVQLSYQPEDHYLVGGAEESHPSYVDLAASYGHLGATQTEGLDRLIGEGAAIFVASAQQSTTTTACLRNIDTLYLTEAAVQSWSDTRLREQLFPDGAPSVDLVISGRPAGNEAQRIYDALEQGFSDEKTIINYKENIGEFPSAAAHGLYLAVEKIANKEAQSVLVINNYGERYLSTFLLECPK